MPATPNVAAEVKDYKGNAAIEAGEAFDPSPANIDARTIRVTLPEWNEAGAAAQENPRRNGQRDAWCSTSAMQTSVTGKSHRRANRPEAC